MKKLLFLLPLLASLSGSGQTDSSDHFWHLGRNIGAGIPCIDCHGIDTTQPGGYTFFSFAFMGQPYISFYDSGKNRHSYLDKDWLVDSGKVIIYGDTVTVIRNIVKLYLEQERKKDSIQRLLTNRGVILDMITGSAQTFKPSDSTIGISSNGDIVTSGLAIDTPHVIESGCYFTFPNGKQITCDSLYKLFQKVSNYENKLDSLIKEMREPKLGPHYTINEAVHGYDSLKFSITVPPSTVGWQTVGWQKDCDTCRITFFGFYPGRAGVISNYSTHQ